MMPEPVAVIPLQYATAADGRTRVGTPLRVALIAAWAACALAWGLIAFADVESVLFTGPVIAVLGLAVALWGWRENGAGFVVAGAAHVGICLLFVVLVNVRNWSPAEATLPFVAMGAAHVIGSGVASAGLLLRRKLGGR